MGALLAGYNAANAAGVGYAVRDVAAFVEKQLRIAGLYEHLVLPGGDGRSR
jgi:anti-sigma B factor antagonist